MGAKLPVGKVSALAFAWTLAFLVTTAIADGASATTAPAGPRTPCSAAPYPAFPAPNGSPNVELWSGEELGANWTPPSCTGWESSPADLVVALAGRFASGSDADGLLDRIGRISGLSAVRYWSVTDKEWNPLFVRAIALGTPDPAAVRGDFSADEIRRGAALYFLATDNRLGNGTITRLILTANGPGHIVLETTNVSPLRWYWFVVTPAGGARTLYFLDRQSDGSWQFYSLSRISQVSSLFSRFVARESYVNRAVAMYRYMADIPTDRDPPAAP